MTSGSTGSTAKVGLLSSPLKFHPGRVYSRQVTPEDAAEFNEPTDALYKLQKEFGSLFESEL